MNDILIFDKNERELENLIQTIETYNQDTGIAFSLVWFLCLSKLLGLFNAKATHA